MANGLLGKTRLDLVVTPAAVAGCLLALPYPPVSEAGYSKVQALGAVVLAVQTPALVLQPPVFAPGC